MTITSKGIFYPDNNEMGRSIEELERLKSDCEKIIENRECVGILFFDHLILALDRAEHAGFVSHDVYLEANHALYGKGCVTVRDWTEKKTKFISDLRLYLECVLR